MRTNKKLYSDFSISNLILCLVAVHHYYESVYRRGPEDRSFLYRQWRLNKVMLLWKRSNPV